MNRIDYKSYLNVVAVFPCGGGSLDELARAFPYVIFQLWSSICTWCFIFRANEMILLLAVL